MSVPNNSKRKAEKREAQRTAENSPEGREKRTDKGTENPFGQVGFPAIACIYFFATLTCGLLAGLPLRSQQTHTLLQPSESGGLPQVEAIGGTVQGPVVFPAGGNGPARRFKVGDREIPDDEVVFIRFPDRFQAPAEALAFLRGGGEIFATIEGGDEGSIILRAVAARAEGSPADGPSAVRLTLSHEALQCLGFPQRVSRSGNAVAELRRWLKRPQKPGAGGDAPADSAANEKDRLLLTEGAELSGLLQKIDAAAVHFQTDAAGEVKLPIEKVRAVALSEVSGPISGQRAAGAPPAPQGGPPSGPEVLVQFQDGGSLLGVLLTLDATQVKLKTAAAGTIVSPIEQVQTIGVRSGRCRFLSDIEPLRVVNRGDLFKSQEMRRDLSVTGDPITLRGREFKKGLGMLSHCRADYDLKGEYSRFQALIGMDDRARPETQEARDASGGIAVFRVIIDDKVAMEKQLGWSDPPLPVDVAIDGARTLSLELDYGPGFLVLDRGDWADARIIRKK